MNTNSKQEKKWLKVKEIVTKINNYIKNGYLVSIKGEFITRPFVITETEIMQKPSKHVTYRWYENDSEYDHGVYTPLKKIFGKIKVYQGVSHEIKY